MFSRRPRTRTCARTPPTSSSSTVSSSASERLRLGLDVNGAEIHTAGKVDKQLQLTAGGNYALTRDDTLDFAVLAGWFNGPRFGLILGISVKP